MSTKGNKFQFPFLFAANKQKFAIFVFGLQKTKRSCHFPYIYDAILIYVYRYIHIHAENYIYDAVSNRKRKLEAQAIFLNINCLFIVQTEVCCLSVCWRRNKCKLPICKLTKRTKRTGPSMPMHIHKMYPKRKFFSDSLVFSLPCHTACSDGRCDSPEQHTVLACEKRRRQYALSLRYFWY
jgi:hypothetical protein